MARRKPDLWERRFHAGRRDYWRRMDAELAYLAPSSPELARWRRWIRRHLRTLQDPPLLHNGRKP